MSNVNNYLKEEREKAKKLLQTSAPKSPAVFDLSDLKSDKTLFIESPRPPKAKESNAFEPSEFSARSTTLKFNRDKRTLEMMKELEEIMATSDVPQIRQKFRESMSSMSFRPTRFTEESSFKNSESDDLRSSSSNFWDKAEVAQFSLNGGKNDFSLGNESFKPSEEMMDKLYEDQLAQDQEYAEVPQCNNSEASSNWQDLSQFKQPEMSFGAHCREFVAPSIREIYDAKSPVKRSNRVPMVDVSLNNTEKSLADVGNSLRFSQVYKMTQEIPTPTLKGNNAFAKYRQEVAETNKIIRNDLRSNSNVQSCSDLLNSLNFEKAFELSKKEIQRSTAVIDDEFLSDNPTKDDENSNPNRGQKRRTSSTFETPLSAIEKCMRSRDSDKWQKQREEMSSKLKPAMSESTFKVPLQKNDSTPTNGLMRQYDMSEKFSLPNYNLARSTSTPCNSRIMLEDGQLKRTTSQLSNGSEFQEDHLPLRFQKSLRKLSFPTCKLNSITTMQITIQNGSDKKLSLAVKVVGVGFSLVQATDNFRMIPKEVRTYQVRFQPMNIGAHRGELIFELATNNKVFKAIPLYGYGGHVSIRTEGIQKAPVGPHFLTMGFVQNVNNVLEQIIRFTNVGNLPGFAVIATKQNEICSTESIHVHPNDLRLAPGETKEVSIKFKPRKDEIRKIVNSTREVIVVGELYMLTSDEATRLRLFKKQDQLPEKLADILPDTLEEDDEIFKELEGFNENFDEKTLNSMVQKVVTQDIALTLNRNMDETHLIAAQVSMSDDSMSFCDDTTMINNHTKWDEADEDEFPIEGKLFRILQSSIVFKRSEGCQEKFFQVQSVCDEVHYIKLVPSNPCITAIANFYGKMQPRENVSVKVSLIPEAFQEPNPAFITVIVGNDKMDIPVKFV